MLQNGELYDTTGPPNGGGSRPCSLAAVWTGKYGLDGRAQAPVCAMPNNIMQWAWMEGHI